MTISPMQLDHVTREEFGEFKIDAEIHFDNVEAGIRDLKTLTMEGFDGMDRLIKNSFIEFGDKLDKTLDEKFMNNNRLIISQLDKKMDERFKEADKKLDIRLERNKQDIIAVINSSK
ncbi:MAG: hypothetical protein WCO48_03305 [Candidatus Taylorbacteria bacterium]